MVQVLVSGVCERDIDLLLLEECIASPGFVQWLVASIGFDEAQGSSLARAERSATRSNGESDLEFLLVHPTSGAKYMLMLENKIAANFQHGQAKRYVERGQGYISRGECTDFRTVLVAPQKYLGGGGSTKGFSAAITYEAILNWFATAYTGQSRLHHLSRMLEAAVEKAIYGYQLKEDEAVTAFWRRYWELSCELARELELPEPAAKPARSGFIHFQPPELPRKVKLYHKVNHGNVDLEFAGLGSHTNQLRQVLSGFLERNMRVVKAAKSAVVRLSVRKIDMNAPLEHNIDLMATGLSEAKHLWKWYVSLPEDIKFAAFQLNKAIEPTR